MRPSKRVVALAVLACLALTGLGVAAATSQAATCSVALGSNCGPYDYTASPMSNGYDTYVSNQSVGPQSGTTQTVTAADPGNWSMTADDQPYGYTGVQTFPDVQQLTNDWCGTGWGGCASTSDTPLASLSALSVKYAESSPTDANSIYEFAPDVWNDSYGSDVMFWADTSPTRCTDNGMSSSNILGQASLGGQNWTVYRYGGVGSEIIFILDGSASTDPVSSGTCARQASGTIDILGGYQWLASHGVMSSLGSLSQLNTGWEITSADHTTFTMKSYAISATVGSNPTPAPSTTSPTPSPSTSSPAATPTPTPTSSSPAPTPTFTAPGAMSNTGHVTERFSWGAVSQAPGYQFELETAAGAAVLNATVSVPRISAQVAKDTGYKWRVRVTGGPWSAWKSFTSP